MRFNLVRALTASVAMSVLCIFGASGSALAQAGQGNGSSVFTTNAFQVSSHTSRKKKKRSSYNRSKKKQSSSKSAPKKEEDSLALAVGSVDGPVQIVISIPDQRMNVYKGGQRIATSRVSTGKAGHRTPMGVFSILEKNRTHFSNLYGGAPMPFMQRVTWSGIALHAGVVPGYPASHGCIRLPHSFARQLFGITDMGGHVVISNAETSPVEISHDSLLQPISFASLMGSGPTTALAPLPKQPAKAALGGADGQNVDGQNVDGKSKAIATNWSDGGAANANSALGLKINASVVTDAPAEAAAIEQPAVSPQTALSIQEQLADFEASVEKINIYESRSKAPLRILITRRTGNEQVKDAQRLLNQLGFDAGDVDGAIGKQSIAAIKAFQTGNALPVTGQVSRDLVRALYLKAGLGEPATGHLYVRQKYRDLLDVPVVIHDEDEPLGTHLFTAMDFGKNDGRTRWTAVTTRGAGAEAGRKVPSLPVRKSEADEQPTEVAKPIAVSNVPGNSAVGVLQRVEIPQYVRDRLALLLTPGSSIIVTDEGISYETGKYTDFIVLNN